MRRRTVLAGAVAPLVLVLAGCGSDNPKPAPPETSSASPSASPSVVAPTMPAEAKGTGPEAAKAFVRHFIATLNYAQTTGDTSTLRQLYGALCSFCEGVSDGLDRVQSHGGSIKTDGWSVRRLRASQGGTTVIALVRVAPQVVVMRQGGKPERFDGQEHGRRKFDLQASHGQWTVTNLTDIT
jgi:hypothetical protein